MALRLIRNDSPQTLSYLDQIEPNPDDLGLQEGRIWAALSRRDWGRALTWIEALPADLRESEGWRYWRARALEKMGHDAQAGALFRMVARERSYYGFLAADRLGADYHLENIPLEIGDFDLASVAALPGLQRARELHFFGRLVLARLEWDKATRKLNQEKLQVAAKLAQGWGWHDRAIFTLARTGYWDDLELRFPLEYQGQIETTAHSHGLDSAWIFAV
ncbi:MAG: lytic murein transglycosylase, partial [Gammaproteobacteria bacterium]|nr:lytic murein transglycosylase [Gammaproteobacteria bacterium]